MANTKPLFLCHTSTTTNYAIIKRNIDGYYLNDADGEFTLSPTDCYLPFTEDSIAKGLFFIYESRKKWDDGNYTLVCYQQNTAIPNPLLDTILSATTFTVMDDTEITNYDIINVNNAIGMMLNGGQSITKIKTDLTQILKQLNMVLPLLRDINIKKRNNNDN